MSLGIALAGPRHGRGALFAAFPGPREPLRQWNRREVDGQPARFLAVSCCRRPLPSRSRRCFPGYARWRLADLPQYLAAEQVNRLIAACDGEVVAAAA